MTPVIVAHRCGPDVYPEQSIQSARHALSLDADMVEMDIQYTKDGRPVICHDPNTLRIFGEDRLVSEMSFDRFMSLRHAADPAYASHSLENVLEAGISPILFHCKMSGEPLRDLVSRLKAHTFEDRCMIGVGKPEDVKLIRSLSDKIRILAFMPGPDDLGRFLNTEADIIRLWESWLNAERARAIHEAGKKLYIMASDDACGGVGYTTEKAMRGFAAFEPDGILVNDIRFARRIYPSNI